MADGTTYNMKCICGSSVHTDDFDEFEEFRQDHDFRCDDYLCHTTERQTEAVKLGANARAILEHENRNPSIEEMKDLLFVLDLVEMFFKPGGVLHGVSAKQRNKWREVAREKGIIIQ